MTQVQLQMVNKNCEAQRNGWLNIWFGGEDAVFEQVSPFKHMLVDRAALDHAFPAPPANPAQISAGGLTWTFEVGEQSYRVGISQVEYDADMKPIVESFIYEDWRQGDIISLRLSDTTVRFAIREKSARVPEIAWRLQLSITRLAYAHLNALPNYLNGQLHGAAS